MTIQTTMRYLHFVEVHAQKKLVEGEKAELLELAGSGENVATKRSGFGQLNWEAGI